MDGSWRAIEAFINGEAQENIDGLMVASEGYCLSIGLVLMEINILITQAMKLKNGMVNVEIS